MLDFLVHLSAIVDLTVHRCVWSAFLEALTLRVKVTHISLSVYNGVQFLKFLTFEIILDFRIKPLKYFPLLGVGR